MSFTGHSLIEALLFGRSLEDPPAGGPRGRYVRGFRTQQVGHSQRLWRGSPPIATAGDVEILFGFKILMPYELMLRVLRMFGVVVHRHINLLLFGFSCHFFPPAPSRGKRDI